MSWCFHTEEKNSNQGENQHQWSIQLSNNCLGKQISMHWCFLLPEVFFATVLPVITPQALSHVLQHKLELHWIPFIFVNLTIIRYYINHMLHSSFWKSKLPITKILLNFLISFLQKFFQSDYFFSIGSNCTTWNKKMFVHRKIKTTLTLIRWRKTVCRQVILIKKKFNWGITMDPIPLSPKE